MFHANAPGVDDLQEATEGSRKAVSERHVVGGNTGGVRQSPLPVSSPVLPTSDSGEGWKRAPPPPTLSRRKAEVFPASKPNPALKELDSILDQGSEDSDTSLAELSPLLSADLFTADVPARGYDRAAPKMGFINTAFVIATRQPEEPRQQIQLPSSPAPAVPEPSTWVMLLLGFGAVGWTMRTSPRSLGPYWLLDRGKS
jgi:hypothetical protein